MVSQVLYYNQAQQYPGIQSDFKGVKSHVEKIDSTDKILKASALDAIPMLRRTSSLSDKVDKGDFVPAAGLTAIAIMQLPEDLNDIKEGVRQAKCKITGQKYEGKYDNKVAQHEFSFLRNSLLEKWAAKNKTVKKAMDYLRPKDKALYKTGFGKKVRNLLSIGEGEEIETKMKNDFGEEVSLNKIKAKESFGDLTARAMKRTTFLGLGALALVEAPKIISSLWDGNTLSEQLENTTRQTTRSFINVAATTAGVAYCGAIGAKHGKALGSLVGMGIGASFGSLISNKIQDFLS